MRSLWVFEPLIVVAAKNRGNDRVSEYYFSVSMDRNKSLCLAPLTERRPAASGQEIQAKNGYFLYEQDGEDENARIEILAHAVSAEAALKLRKLFRMD